MANQIPLLEGTDGAGGFLVHPIYGQLLQDAILRQSAVMQLSRTDRVAGNRQLYDVYSGRPTVGWVDEGAPKPTSGASFNQLSIHVKKLAAIVLYTEELLEDAVEDPRVLVNQDVEAAFGHEIDAQSLGVSNETAIGSPVFDNTLAACTQSVQLTTAADSFATAVSAAIGKVEANGYKASGVVAGWKLRQYLRDQRGASSNATVPVFTEGYSREPDSLYGQPIAYTNNLTGYKTSGAEPVAIVGDFQQAIHVMRRDVSMRSSDQASITMADSSVHSMWQENKIAAMWEQRLGFGVHDLNRAFCVIKNAT